MKIAPIIPQPGTPDEIIHLIDAINRNFQDIEQLTRRGLRVPLGQPGLPSIGFQNPGFDGIGASGMQEPVTGAVQGILWESNAIRQRAASPASGAVAEVVPRDVPDAGGIPARISALETDVQADPENFSRVDLQAGTDMKIESYKRGAAPLRDLVLGVDDGVFTESVRINKSGTVSMTGDTKTTGDFVWLSGTSFTGTLSHNNSANRVYTFKDAPGIVAFTTDAPTAHHTSHEAGGSDPIKLDDLAAPDDNTDLDATTSAHGLMQKFPGGTTTFLRADATFAAPSSTGDLVYVAGASTTDISEVTNVTVVTRGVTSVGATDQLVVKGSFLIKNDSAATRVYVIAVDFNGAFVVEFTTGVMAASATLLHSYMFEAHLNIQSTSLADAIFRMNGELTAGRAGGDDATMVATLLDEQLWGTTTNDLTGTCTVTLKIRSSNANPTQECLVKHFEIRKMTPT